MKTIILNLTAAMFIVTSLQTYAQGFVYDQQSATNGVSINANNVDGLDIQPAPLTQSFTPSFATIVFVQLQFWDVPLINNGNSGATVYVNLWTGSPNINSAALISSTTPVYMPDGFGNLNPGVTNFYFSSPIAITPGQAYYIQPVVQSGDNPWDIIAIGNTYPNGQLFASGAGFNSDLWFREGVLATPEPATLSLAGLGGILSLALKRRTKRFILPIIVLQLVENRTMKTMILNLIAAIFVAASLQTRAQGFVYDQQSATNPISPVGNGNVDGLNIQTAPLTQSFIPTLSTIGFIQLEFETVPPTGANGATVYVNLWTGSPNVNSATLLGSTTPVYMPSGFVSSGLGVAGVTNFYFSILINLTPGQTYYLQPVVQSGDNPWVITAIGNTYPNGQLYGSGAFFQPSTDLWFREGVLAVPEPGVLALVGIGITLFFILKRRSKLLMGSSMSVFLLCSIHAQTNSDSVVQVSADIAGLTPVAAADLPSAGTFLVLQPDARGQLVALPFPFLPANYSSLPIYQVTENTFLVDDTGGRLMEPSAVNRNTAPPAVAAQAQMQFMSNIIAQLQFATNGGKPITSVVQNRPC